MSCRALVVVDHEGLAIAELDAVEPWRASLEEVLSLADSEAPVDQLGDRSVGELAGVEDSLSVEAPTVLRAQGSDVLAWDNHQRAYIALRRLELAVLATPLFGRTIRGLAEALDEQVDEVRSAVGLLGFLGIVEIEVAADAEPDELPANHSHVNDSLFGDVGACADQADDDESHHAVDVEGERPSGEEGENEAPSVHSLVTDEPDDNARIIDWATTPREVPSQPSACLPEPDFELEPTLKRPLVRRVLSRGRRIAGQVRRRLTRIAAPKPLDAPTISEPVETGDQAIDEQVTESPSAVSEGTPLHLAETAVPYAELEAELKPELEVEPEPEPEAGLELAHDEPAEQAGLVVDWRDSDHRVAVHAIYHSPEHNAALGLGLIMSYARVYDDGALNNVYDLRRARIDAQPTLDELERRGRPCVALFSDFMWSMQHNLGVSAEVKRLVPKSLTVHGGPHAPKYAGDAERFFDDHPHVDVIVRGEGELTVAALLEAIDGDLDRDRLEERLAEVEGITFRVPTAEGHRLVRTPDRARGTDMSIFPSPYLTGEFDEIDPARWRSATIETNRGCPYGCTYCDWGSATLSRIRKFPLERVKAELEWLTARGISEIFFADANFGIYARDVEIAEHLSELKRTYGAPAGVICSFAKNTTKYTVEIVRSWVESGMCAEGSVALQTTDPITLRNVKRGNIKIEKYDDLAEEFRRLGLPIVTDLLMGLPGATVASFKEDLQRCIERDVTPRMMETSMLPNSPMNAPDYREQFQIQTDAADVIVATSSYTRDDFDEMLRLRLLFRALEHYGLLRHLFRWLQHEHGLRAVDFIHDIDSAIAEDPHRYPLLTWVGRYFDLMTVPPGGWPPFYDEVVDLLSERHGVERDDAMDTVIRVQEFLMPTRHRQFPDEVDLRHDYVSWYQNTLDGPALADRGRRLSEYGPGRLIVDDPAGVCDARLLRNQFSMRRLEACDNPFWVLNDWELRSELMRPMATAIPVLQA